MDWIICYVLSIDSLLIKFPRKRIWKSHVVHIGQQPILNSIRLGLLQICNSSSLLNPSSESEISYISLAKRHDHGCRAWRIHALQILDEGFGTFQMSWFGSRNPIPITNRHNLSHMTTCLIPKHKHSLLDSISAKG